MVLVTRPGCDQYFDENEAKMEKGIKGLSSGIFYANVKNKYHETGDAISSSTKEVEYNLGGHARGAYITVDMYTR